MRDVLSRELNINHRGDLGTYLGMKIEISYKASDFLFLIEKLRDRIHNWHSKSLSSAGWVVLINSVLSALPAYHRNYT